ncbi:MAG: ATP-binding protein [Pseudomonadales bacterium]|nr:ATP-binding protein [Pseudomonadales bacterium]
MDTIVGHHLQRASVGSNPLAGARTPVAEAARRIAAGLERLHADRSLTIAVDVDEDIVVSVDERDLYEVLGNLLENACKYGEAQVRIRAEPQRGEVRLCVEDDGPGVPEALRGDVLARGARADTAKAGQGIGLAVVAELVAAYGGTLEIGVSDLGGAAVALLLPTAPGRRPAADQSESVSVSREESRPAASKLARKRIGLQQTAQSSK